ncbi:helix-turn-helix domain-containing protein [Amnibacterium sp. CER49]|uniref:helix-turn-helix domain-containing protein n=1 Tax=Amnibacterium sp. CER49 TaxID=3039161 RepID=UPI00244928A6|nr:helix-turn-helix domain-containing protein [Amnibacterium sp. CER49]MDH2444500.1 helix-turn-helix domain-containing protein [Amnibacterium sp. CER49]
MVDAEESLAVSTLGATVRVQRQRQGLSVQALGQRAGVSSGLISELERGHGNPSFTSLSRIAAALNLPLPKLLSGVVEDSMVVRASERPLLPTSADEPAERQARRELLTPPSETVLQLIRSTLPPGFSNEGRPYRHLGTETVTVESGGLLVVHGERRVELAPGDTITYGCSTPHWWANPTGAETVVLGAVTPFES